MSKRLSRAWRAGFSESGAFDSLLLNITDRLVCGFYTMTLLPLLNNSINEKGSLIFRKLFSNIQLISFRSKTGAPIWLVYAIIQLILFILTLSIVFCFFTIS